MAQVIDDTQDTREWSELNPKERFERDKRMYQDSLAHLEQQGATDAVAHVRKRLQKLLSQESQFDLLEPLREIYKLIEGSQSMEQDRQQEALLNIDEMIINIVNYRH